MVVRCEGEAWNVHRVVLASMSKYFARACAGNFLVRWNLSLCWVTADFYTQEGNLHAIKLHEDNPEMVHQMLFSFYDHDYEDDTSGKNPLDFNVGMYAIADKYDVSLLKDLAEMKFSAALLKYNSTMIQHLVKAIKVIYTTTLNSDRRLRQCLFPVLKTEGQSLRKDKQIEELLRSGFADGDFTMDMIDAQLGSGWTHCRDCGKVLSPPERSTIGRCSQCIKRLQGW